MAIIWLFVCIGTLLQPNRIEANPSCVKPKEGLINIHIVPHTHDDVGWLKTVDQYYYGARNDIQNAGVQYILDTVVQELLKDPERKFIYVESAFFFRWWNEQTEQMKETVKKLVESGQLEFINGGWCMNDEAAAHYNAIIDQMTLGMARLNDTFGSAAHPRIAWQIDPFGHSKEQASLFAQMGFDGLFFGRLDWQEKSERWEKKKLEMVWEASDNLGDAAWLFTGVLPNNYSPPPGGFCFDSQCDSPPVMDDPNLQEYNVPQKIDAFYEAVNKYGTGYKTSNIMVTMGEDFNYQNALSWFKNLDKLIRHINEQDKEIYPMNLFYSTPSCYLDALYQANETWPTKTDDFFPYSSDAHAFWTGYFTSRPALKGYVRSTNNILQAVKQLTALTQMPKSKELNVLIEAMGVAQHHDAVSGTAKQHVTDDYNLRLHNGIVKGVGLMNDAINMIKLNDDTNMELCPYLNISMCPTVENSKYFKVMVYNPLAHTKAHVIRIPVEENTAYKIMGPDGHGIEAQLVPLPESLFKVPGRNSSARFELVFHEPQLPPLGFKEYTISKASNRRVLLSQKSKMVPKNKEIDTAVDCGAYKITVDKETEKFKEILHNSPNGMVNINITEDWSWYQGMAGNNSKDIFRASGAYIFRPNGTADSISKNITTTIYNGNLVCEFHQVWSDWVSQVVRFYKNAKEIEMEWIVGPIPIDDGAGKEIVHRIRVNDLKTSKTFYTDANGREIQKRIVNYRPSYHILIDEPIAANYYPVNSRLILKGTNKNLNAVVFNDRSQGGTSMKDGEIELMVHRRLLYDDAFGVGEPLNETAYGEGLVVRGKHYYSQSDMLSKEDCDFDCHHVLKAKELLLQPIMLFLNLENAKQQSNERIMEWSGAASLPPNVHLLTLEPWKENKLLIRLEHQFPKGNSSYNQPIDVNLMDSMKAFNIISLEETTLAANQWKSENRRYKWKTTSSKNNKSDYERSQNTIDYVNPRKITLNPMEIRTFIATIR